MKCLTICQPYAHLICLPDDDDRAKRVENRKWGTSYRGPLLIHAGKSRDWLDLSSDGMRDEGYDIPISAMTFGAIIGIANLALCYDIGDSESAIRRFPWLAGHQHVEGPFCWVLTEVRKFDSPISYRGAQGLFDVPHEVVAEQFTWP